MADVNSYGCLLGQGFSLLVGSNTGAGDGCPGPKTQQGPDWIAQATQTCSMGTELPFTVISFLLTLCFANYEMQKIGGEVFIERPTKGEHDCVKSMVLFPRNSRNTGEQGLALAWILLHIFIKGSNLLFYACAGFCSKDPVEKVSF